MYTLTRSNSLRARLLKNHAKAQANTIQFFGPRRTRYSRRNRSLHGLVGTERTQALIMLEINHVYRIIGGKPGARVTYLNAKIICKVILPSDSPYVSMEGVLLTGPNQGLRVTLVNSKVKHIPYITPCTCPAYAFPHSRGKGKCTYGA